MKEQNSKDSLLQTALVIGSAGTLLAAYILIGFCGKMAERPDGGAEILARHWHYNWNDSGNCECRLVN